MTNDRIITYKSDDAPEGCRWMARILVPIEPDSKKAEQISKRQGRPGPHAADLDDEAAGGGKLDLFGFVPVFWSAPTKEEVIAKAKSGWAHRQARIAAQKLRAVKGGRASAERRAK